MKIALVVLGFHSQLGGYGTHVYFYAKELLSAGHDVIILSSTYSPKGVMPEGKSVEAGVPVYRFKSFLKGITPGLLSYLRSSDYDVVHVFGYQSFQPLICLMSGKKPLVFTPFYHPFGEHPRLLRRFFDFFIGRLVFRNVNVIIAQTDYEASLLSNFSSNIKVIPIPFDNLPRVSPNVFRKHFGVKNFILSVGRLSKEKRFDDLIKIYAKLGLKEKLVIAGGGDSKEYLESLCEVLGVKDKVVITGFISRELLSSAYAGASVFTLLSKYESFGLVFAEAMSKGAPCVGLGIGGVPFVIDNGGIIVKNVNEAGDAIKSIITNKRLSKSLSVKALARSKFFDKKLFMKNILSVYKELIK